MSIYLTKSDNNKSKPLRGLLLILARLVAKHPVEEERDLLLGIASCVATRAIRKQEEFANIKPSLQVLEHFISKSLIGAAEIAQINKPEEFGTFRVKSMKKGNPASDTQQELVNQSVQNFALTVLEWMQYPDCAPTVGRFMPLFFKSFEGPQSESNYASKDGVIPLWIHPMKQRLERHPELLENFEIHILPGLLRLGPVDVKAFLKTLPFVTVQRGNIGPSSISDIQLCLLVAKTAEDPLLRKYFGQGQSTSLDLENLGISLLEHSSPSVRITALSLLVSSSASARPFSRRVLRRVQQCIPYFHVEVNAKPRNEFIALMRKLCVRLQGATMSLLRRGPQPATLKREQISPTALPVADFEGEAQVSAVNVIEQAQDEESHILEEHLAFRKWYMLFLLQELRPTASYQSHITALKILSFLREQINSLYTTFSKGHNDYFDALNEHLPRGLFLRPLTDLLSDPFDDVRQSAKSLFDIHLSTNTLPQIKKLQGKTNDEPNIAGQETYNQADREEVHRDANHSILVDLNKAERKAGITGRADHADGFGRLNDLLYTTSGSLVQPAQWHQSRYLIVNRVISTLEREVEIAKDNLLLAVSSRPLHGHLIALR